MTARPPHTGRLARTAIAGAAVARVGVARLGHKLSSRGQDPTPDEATASQARQAHEARLGRILFGALNQLKGTALKAAQLLSMELGLLPEALRVELLRAQYQVTPLNRALVIKLLRQEFGAGPEGLFASFEAEAFAAASLGQVHGATLGDGRDLAVKLQYPGMAASIGSDLALLRMLLRGLDGMGGKRGGGVPRPEVLELVLGEIERTLTEELDYRREAQQLRWFGEQLRGMPDLVLPQPIEALSGARVLSMERLPGLHLKEWLATGPSQAERDRQGQRLFDLFLHSSFALHRLQADPHAGNFLFMPDGRLGLLDFGCTRELRPQFSEQLAAAWCALLRRPRDEPALQRAYEGLGLIAPGLDGAEFGGRLLPALAPLLSWQVRPFSEAVFDFGRHPPPPRPGEQHQRLAMSYLRQMAPDLPYFDRAYLGLLQLLRQLGARVRTGNRWIHG